MDSIVIRAYDDLVPADQLVVDAMIVTLTKKDKQIKELVADIHKWLDAKERDE